MSRLSIKKFSPNEVKFVPHDASKKISKIVDEGSFTELKIALSQKNFVNVTFEENLEYCSPLENGHIVGFDKTETSNYESLGFTIVNDETNKLNSYGFILVDEKIGIRIKNVETLDGKKIPLIDKFKFISKTDVDFSALINEIKSALKNKELGDLQVKILSGYRDGLPKIKEVLKSISNLKIKKVDSNERLGVLSYHSNNFNGFYFKKFEQNNGEVMYELVSERVLRNETAVTSISKLIT